MKRCPECVLALSLAFAAAACGNGSSNEPGNGGASATNAGAPGVAGAAHGGATTSSAAGAATTSGGASTTSGGALAASAGAPGTAGASGSVGSAAGGAGAAGSAHAGGSGAGGNASAGSAGASALTCPSTILKAGDATATLMVGSASRTYLLHVPAKYTGTQPAPLVLDFHGIMSSASGEKMVSTYPTQTDADGAILVFPNGLTGPGGAAWDVGPCCVKDVDDVAFAKAIVSDVEKTACIDPKRVYAVGYSMGGGMSHYLACHAADVFAAVSPAAFDLLQENVADCQPARAISVVSFRSTSDPIVPYAGGYSAVVTGMPITFLGAKATFAKWAELDQCTGAASAEGSNGCASYSGCKDGVDVVLCTKQGGGHDPGNAAVSWPILKKHVLP